VEEPSQESQPEPQESQLVEEPPQESNPISNSQDIKENFTKTQSNNVSKQSLIQSVDLSSNSQIQTKESINSTINKPQINETIKVTNSMNSQNKNPFQSQPQNQAQNSLKNTNPNVNPINSKPKNISFPGKSNTFTENQKPRFNTK